MNFADNKISAIYPAFIIAPQCPNNMFWANVLENRVRSEIHMQPSPSSPMKLLIQLVQKLKNELPVDSNRIYITGLSMGGFGTCDAIDRYPNLSRPQFLFVARVIHQRQLPYRIFPFGFFTEQKTLP
ncbi:MAG TPA: hypothetical protein VIL90_01570 [Puia sp.]